MLDLVLLRHGRACAFQGGITDEERHLTDDGIRTFTLAAQGLAQRLSPPVVIISSPYLRARQTARILREELAEVDLDSCLEESDSRLVPEGRELEAAEMALIKASDMGSGTLLLVSHMPMVGRLAGHFLNTPAPSMATGEACSIDLTGERATLNWRLTEAEASIINRTNQ